MTPEALLDTPAAETVDVNIPESATEVETPETPASDIGQTDQTGAEDTADATGSKLWNDVKEQIKTLPPQLKSAVKRAIFRENELQQRYPEGLNKLEETLGSIASLSDDPNAPPEQVIQEITQERAFFRELDDLYTSGSPALADKLLEADPDAFQSIAPAIFNKLSEVNPEGYSAYIAQAVSSHFAQQEVPLQFAILRTFLPQLEDSPVKDQIISACEKLFGAVDGLNAMAKSPVTKTVGKKDEVNPDFSSKEQELAEKEVNINRQSWNNEDSRYGQQVFESELDKFAAKKLSDDEKQKVFGLVAEELEARLTASKDFGKAMRGYLQAGNKSAYLQRQRSEWKKIIPGAVRHAVNDVLELRPKGAPAVMQGKQNEPAQKQAQKTEAKPLQGSQTQFESIAGHPKSVGMQIDYRRTPHSMLLKNQAYVEGKNNPVTWRTAR